MHLLSKIFYAGVLFPFTVTKSLAQLQVRGCEIGIHAGTLVYQGDLVPGYFGSYRSLKPAFGITIARPLDPYLSVRADLTTGKISANESAFKSPAWRQLRNFNFSTTITELVGSLVFSPYGNQESAGNRRLFPYVFAGAGVAFLRVRRDWRDINTTFYDVKSPVQVGLGIDTLHTTPWLIPVLPVGGGIKYLVSPGLFLNAEVSYRLTSSDYLDGFKYSGNPTNKDSYYGISVGISFLLQKNRYNCPKVF